MMFDIAKQVGSSTLQVISDWRKAAAALKHGADKYRNRYGLLKLFGRIHKNRTRDSLHPGALP